MSKLRFLSKYPVPYIIINSILSTMRVLFTLEQTRNKHRQIMTVVSIPVLQLLRINIRMFIIRLL